MSKQQLNALPAEQRAAMMASKHEYIAFYSRAKDVHLAVSRETGRLLYMLARATNARAMIEFGTSLDISTLHLAAALRDNGGGKLITTEFEATKIARARANIAASGLADLAEVREGDALAWHSASEIAHEGQDGCHHGWYLRNWRSRCDITCSGGRPYHLGRAE